MTIRILLADDHALFRQALRLSLESQPDFAVVAEVANGEALLASYPNLAPDVVCLDLNMPGLDGVATTRQLLSAHPAARVVALSAESSLPAAAAMIAAGARAYVLKERAGSDLPPALRAIVAGAAFLSPELGVGSLGELAAFHTPGDNAG